MNYIKIIIIIFGLIKLNNCTTSKPPDIQIYYTYTDANYLNKYCEPDKEIFISSYNYGNYDGNVRFNEIMIKAKKVGANSVFIYQNYYSEYLIYLVTRLWKCPDKKNKRVKKVSIH